MRGGVRRDGSSAPSCANAASPASAGYPSRLGEGRGHGSRRRSCGTGPRAPSAAHGSRRSVRSA
ncbi:hypothetical protein ABE10_06140 [Bacillus toyonensis]|nr:hypothetical protein [Bacillus toyonensis]